MQNVGMSFSTMSPEETALRDHCAPLPVLAAVMTTPPAVAGFVAKRANAGAISPAGLLGLEQPFQLRAFPQCCSVFIRRWDQPAHQHATCVGKEALSDNAASTHALTVFTGSAAPSPGSRHRPETFPATVRGEVLFRQAWRRSAERHNRSARSLMLQSQASHSLQVASMAEPPADRLC